MILFKTKYQQLFNITINYLLKEELIKENKDFGNIVDNIMPKYIRREQFGNCEKSIENIYKWSSDKFIHNISILEKFCLYNFFKYLIEVKSNLLRKQEYSRKIEKILAMDKLDNNHKKYFDLSWYFKNMFDDPFFTRVEELYNEGNLESYLYTNPEYLNLYWDILPQKIIKIYEEKDDIYKQILKLLDFLQDNINNGSLAYLFWKNNKECSETEIQVMLQNIIDAYFYNEEIDISRESNVGSGEIDFKFYKNKDEKVLFELKKAKNTHLKKGYFNQLIQYMKSTHSKKAFYIIICFNDKDIKQANKFIVDLDDTNEYYAYIKTIIFDVRLNDKKVKNKNKSIFYTNIPEVTDKYFDLIPKITNLSTKEEIIKYLTKIKNNFNKLNNEDLEFEYVNKLNEIAFKDNSAKKMDKLFSNDINYEIEDKNGLKKLTLQFLSDINCENLNRKISNIIEFYESFNENVDSTIITKEEIDETFKFLKNKHYIFYKLLKKIDLQIYLINYVSLEFNSSCIPTTNLQELIIICSYMRDKRIHPVYSFLYLMGLILGVIVTNQWQMIPDNFLEAMMPYTKGLTKDNLDSIILFADSFALYLMHNTEYEKYNHFHGLISDDIYHKLNNYFDTLLEQTNEKGNYK